jgi:hypothetical protein
VTSGGQLKQALPKHLAKPSAAMRRAAVTESGAALAGRIRVLIAEDNAINMKVACGILDRMGYKQARCLPRLDACAPAGGPPRMKDSFPRPSCPWHDRLIILWDLPRPSWDTWSSYFVLLSSSHRNVCEWYQDGRMLADSRGQPGGVKGDYYFDLRR